VITAYATCDLSEPDEALKLFRYGRLSLVEHLARREALPTSRGERRGSEGDTIAYLCVSVDGEGGAAALVRLLGAMRDLGPGPLRCQADTPADLAFLASLDFPGLLVGYPGVRLDGRASG
jgi:hypothetical protein